MGKRGLPPDGRKEPAEKADPKTALPSCRPAPSLYIAPPPRGQMEEEREVGGLIEEQIRDKDAGDDGHEVREEACRHGVPGLFHSH